MPSPRSRKQTASSSGDGLQRHASYATVWQLFFAVVATAIVVVPTTYFTLTHFLEDKLVEHFEPYEHMFYASQLNNMGQFDDAISECQYGFNSIVARSGDPERAARLSAYLNVYLIALAQCDNPTKYRSDCERCRDIFNRHLITEAQWHQRAEGRYFLRVGELALAKTLLEQAVVQARTNADHFTAGWVEYNLAYVYLCSGDAKAAFAHQRAAKRELPAEYNFPYRETDPDNLKFATLYPPFTNALRELQEMFAEKSDILAPESDYGAVWEVPPTPAPDR
jgi:tetratricopeptide (TPR) repeat protein